MAAFIPVPYKDMTPKQKKQAHRWAEIWDSVPEKCPMHPVLGAITNREDVPHLTDIDYQMVSTHVVESACDITDAMRDAFVKAMKRDKIEPDTMDGVKATFAVK